MEQNLNYAIERNEWPCEVNKETCYNRERTISYALFVKLPEEPIVPDLIYKECCTEILVLADQSGKAHKNDYTGMYYQKQIDNENCDFVLIKKSDNSEYQLMDDTFGLFKDFGDITENEKLSTFVVDWSKVLNALGEGAYQLKKNITITGLTFEDFGNTYTLKTYSDLISDKTIRLDVKMNGYLEKENIDFTGSGFVSSIRIDGFFGRREPQYELDNIVYRSKKVENITTKMSNIYKMQSGIIPECLSSQIFDFYLLGTELFANDYNLNNHSYKYKSFPIIYENNEGTKYYTENRKARLNLTFKDRYANNNKINF